MAGAGEGVPWVPERPQEFGTQDGAHDAGEAEQDLRQGVREDALLQLPVEFGRALLEVERPLGQLADDLGCHLLGGRRRALRLGGAERLLLGELRSAFLTPRRLR